MSAMQGRIDMGEGYAFQMIVFLSNLNNTTDCFFKPMQNYSMD